MEPMGQLLDDGGNEVQIDCVNRLDHRSAAVMQSALGIVDNSLLAIWLHDQKPLQRPPLAPSKPLIEVLSSHKLRTETFLLFQHCGLVDAVGVERGAGSLNALDGFLGF